MNVYVCIGRCTCMCVCTRVYRCMGVCIGVCLHVCEYTNVGIYGCTYVHVCNNLF